MTNENISNELKKNVELLKEQGKMLFYEGATEEQLAKFEKDNKISFPKKFREWLLFSDGGILFPPAGIQIYGVSHKPIIDVNCDDRPDNKYIMIGALITGEPILYKKGSEEIAIYDHENGIINDDEIYSDFYSFLKGLYTLLGIGE